MIGAGLRRRMLPAFAAAALAGSSLGAWAQSDGSQTPAPPDAVGKRSKELEAVRAEQKKAAETEKRLKLEIESLGADRRALNQSLIDSANRVRSVEARAAEAELRLLGLNEKEGALRRSLDARRSVIVEVLAALQRIGRRPLPALMVRPEDALESVRTAILLGAVLPEMKDAAETLAADLGELVRLREQIAGERDRLKLDLAAIPFERQRLTLLLDERKRRQAEVEKALAAERHRAQQLAGQASSLQELITKLEQAPEVANRIPSTAPTPESKPPPESRPNLTALKDPGRLVPAVAFASAKGLLPLPVNGVRIREFGAPDGLGGTEKGLVIATRAGAQVTAPCDGWVVYSGSFRSYGRLLILNAGGGYHVVLAGMERISVDIGQFVLTGEPVAAMGDGAPVASAVGSGSSQPVLYIEFRKDGVSVDPNPWWATTDSEKVRG
jgi:murein hydrolase activator